MGPRSIVLICCRKHSVMFGRERVGCGDEKKLYGHAGGRARG